MVGESARGSRSNSGERTSGENGRMWGRTINIAPLWMAGGGGGGGGGGNKTDLSTSLRWTAEKGKKIGKRIRVLKFITAPRLKGGGTEKKKLKP